MAARLHRQLIRAGNGADRPKRGDEVIIEYTGWLHDPGAAANQYRGQE